MHGEMTKEVGIPLGEWTVKRFPSIGARPLKVETIGRQLITTKCPPYDSTGVKGPRQGIITMDNRHPDTQGKFMRTIAKIS